MITHVYSVLKEQVEDIPDLELVDWYLGQFDQQGEDYIKSSPAAYIQFFDPLWETLAKKVQRATLTFRIYLVSQTAHGNENDMLDTNLINHPYLESLIYTSINNKSYSLSQALGVSLENDQKILSNIVRKSSNFHHRLSNLIVTYQDFECTVFDYSALPFYQKVLAELNLHVQHL